MQGSSRCFVRHPHAMDPNRDPDLEKYPHDVERDVSSPCTAFQVAPGCSATVEDCLGSRV